MSNTNDFSGLSDKQLETLGQAIGEGMARAFLNQAMFEAGNPRVASNLTKILGKAIAENLLQGKQP